MLTKQDAKNLADKILSYSKLPGCSVTINASETVFIRFANNGITTSGYSLDQTVSIESTTDDKRSGSANVSEWSDDALKNRRGTGRAPGQNLAAGSRIHAAARSATVSRASEFRFGHRKFARRRPHQPRQSCDRRSSRRQAHHRRVHSAIRQLGRRGEQSRSLRISPVHRFHVDQHHAQRRRNQLRMVYPDFHGDQGSQWARRGPDLSGEVRPRRWQEALGAREVHRDSGTGNRPRSAI